MVGTILQSDLLQRLLHLAGLSLRSFLDLVLLLSYGIRWCCESRGIDRSCSIYLSSHPSSSCSLLEYVLDGNSIRSFGSPSSYVQVSYNCSNSARYLWSYCTDFEISGVVGVVTGILEAVLVVAAVVAVELRLGETAI